MVANPLGGEVRTLECVQEGGIDIRPVAVLGQAI